MLLTIAILLVTFVPGVFLSEKYTLYQFNKVSDINKVLCQITVYSALEKPTALYRCSGDQFCWNSFLIFLKKNITWKEIIFLVCMTSDAFLFLVTMRNIIKLTCLD